MPELKIRCGAPRCHTMVNPVHLPVFQQCVALAGMDEFASVCRKCFLRSAFRHMSEPHRTIMVERILDDERRAVASEAKRNGHGPTVLPTLQGQASLHGSPETDVDIPLRLWGSLVPPCQETP